jgi:hypothetical protein
VKPYFDKIIEQLTSPKKDTKIKKALEKALNIQKPEKE